MSVQSVNILVIDDDPKVPWILSEGLGNGYAVDSARDGKEGINKISRLSHVDRPELILLDIQMPGMNGIEVLEKLKAESEDEATGIKLIASILEEPLRMLAQNSGMDAGFVANEVKKQKSATFGFNALTNEFGDMVAAGVIEPAKVAMSALKNAASVGSMILTTECLVTDAPKKEEHNHAAGGMGGGMPGMM